MALFNFNRKKKNTDQEIRNNIVEDITMKLDPKQAEIMEKVNQATINEFCERYPQYKDYDVELDIRKVNNLKRFHEKYTGYSKETIPSYCLKVNLEKFADEFFEKHPQYINNFAIGDIFLANSFFSIYTNLEDKKNLWTMPAIENFLEETKERKEEINKFYGENPEYIGEVKTKEEMTKINKFYEDFPATKGEKWSMEAIDKMYELDVLKREEINAFYEKYPEYRGDYLKKGRILSVEEISDLEFFHEKYIDNSLRGVKWDLNVVRGFKTFNKEEVAKELNFYKKFPEYKGKYLTTTEMDSIINAPELKLGFKIQQRTEEIKEVIIKRLDEIFGKIKLKILPKNNIFKRASDEVAERHNKNKNYIKSKFKEGLRKLKEEYNKIRHYKKIRHQKELEIFNNERPEYNENQLTYKEYKQIRNFYRDYPYYNEFKINLEDIPVFREFFENNPEYKNTAIKVEDLHKANEFTKTYPELLKGKKWDINDMYQLMEDGQSKENQDEIKRFYKENPEYRGIYLDKNNRDKVETFYSDFENIKGEKPWKIEMIDKIYNDVNEYERAYINDFYRKYPQYKGTYTGLEDMKIMNKFFKDNPDKVDQNWEIKAMQDYTNGDEIHKERILRIYKYNPKFEGVYLSEPEKAYLEYKMPKEPEKLERVEEKNKTNTRTLE